jgi:hypothetical protein
MVETTVKRRKAFTVKRTLIEQILKGLKDLTTILVRRRPVSLERIVEYADTISTFSAEAIRENPNELGRINAMLAVLRKETKDDELIVRIKYLQDLIKTTLQQASFEEE